MKTMRRIYSILCNVVTFIRHCASANDYLSIIFRYEWPVYLGELPNVFYIRNVFKYDH